MPAAYVSQNGDGPTPEKALLKEEESGVEELAGVSKEKVPVEDAYYPWRHLLPVQCQKTGLKELPLRKAGLINLIFCHWAAPMIWSIYKKGRATREMIYDSPPEHSSPRNHERFWKAWQDELQEHGEDKASLVRAIVAMVKQSMVFTCIMAFLWIVSLMVVPLYFVRTLLQFTSEPYSERSLAYGLTLTAGFFAFEMLKAGLVGNTFVISMYAAHQVKTGILSCVFKKVLRIRTSKSQNMGELINIFTNDAQRIYQGVYLTWMLLTCSLLVIGAVFGLVSMGPYSLIGLSVIGIFVPFQGAISKLVMRYKRGAIIHTDERVGFVTQIVNSIKLVKSCAWEKSCSAKVKAIRQAEETLLRKGQIVNSITISTTQLGSMIGITATILASVYGGQGMSVTEAFTFLSLLFTVRVGLSMSPFAFKALAEANVSCTRVKRILLLPELEPMSEEVGDPNNLVQIVNASFKWVDAAVLEEEEELNSSVSEEETPEGESEKVEMVQSPVIAVNDSIVEEFEREEPLQDINFILKKGQLIGVCGSVGSGKSALLHAIMGQMEVTSGKVAGKGRIAYVAQQAWILNATLKENIIFGNPYCESRYNEVLAACGLEPDLLTLAAGDQTEIGERGINLSGGQKQRVSLARAVYEEADLYLLDDPLSAVDAHVGHHIFEHCISKLMKGKTTVLVSHQLQYLQSCDHILVIKDGRIQEEGKHSELMNKKGEYEYLIKTFHSSHGDSDPDHQGDQQQTDGPEQAELKSSKWLLDPSLVGEFRERALSSAIDSSHGNSSDNASRPRLHSHHGRVTSLSPSAARRQHNGFLSPETAASPLSSRTPGSPGLSGSRFLFPVTHTPKGSRRNLGPDLSVSMACMGGAGLVTALEMEALHPNMKEETTPAGKLIEEERLEVGAIGLSSLLHYMRAGGMTLSIFTAFTFTLVSGLLSFNSFWLSYWFEQSKTNITIGNYSYISEKLENSENFWMYSSVYILTGVLIFFCVFLQAVSNAKFCINASSNLHKRLLSHVLACPMSFFETTPLGQVINRFSKDMDEMDTQMPFVAELSISSILFIIMSQVVTLILFPYFIVPAAIWLILLYFALKVLHVGVRETKRLDNVTKSLVISHVSTSLQGITTLRAFKREEEVLSQFQKVHDVNAMAFAMFQATLRYTTTSISYLCVSLSLAVTLFVVLTDLDPAYAGLMLAFSVNTSSMFPFTCRTMIEANARFTSVQRVLSYILMLPSELTNEKGGTAATPPDGWPSEGRIVLRDFSLRYRPGLPMALKSVCCAIKAGEKIGIVGRTGSGKSSLGVALFRLVEAAEGCIEIDGVDISTITLERLRSKLAIIPQDPVLFSGTIRYNLDPFSLHSDTDLWISLEKCHLKQLVQSFDKQLEFKVSENGENFSVGERQLICIARALLRHNRIVVLDEATAAIDTETDSLIQETIKECFADCTTLTIAHRLNTVMNSDRIIVMDDGKIIEIGSPSFLTADKTSAFSQMVSVQESKKQQAMSQ